MVRSSLVWAETPARLLSWLGNASQVVLIVAILAVLLVLRGRKGEGLWLALTVLSGWLAGDIAKFVYQRQRPVDVGLIPLPTSSSYPSGHATTAAVLVTAILVLVFREVDNRGVRIAITTGLVAFSLGVGLSRISLGVHYAGDVIGGWMLGAGWALAASLLLPERTSD
jgi:undecaprenyl-diphosphatase